MSMLTVAMNLVYIVLVGDASTFVQDLPGVGFDEFETISLADLDLSTADLRRAR